MPWSMCPAVPTTMVIPAPRPARRERPQGRPRPVVGRIDRPQVEQDGAVLDPRHDRPDRPSAAGGRARRGRGQSRPARPTRASRPAATRRRWPRPSRSRTPAPGPRAGSAASSASARRPSASGVAAIIRQTGMSVVARPARYSPRVAASAASVTFSGRTARASGSFRIRAIRSARPTMSPACGPPTSLSPLNVTRSAPRRQPLARGRFVGQAEGGRLEQRPAPEVVDDDRAVRVGEAGELDRVGRLHEAGSARSSTGWTRRTTVARPSASGASKSAARVRLVVPTSTSRAPVRRTISGIRTPPPISTSSPRETATPCLPASPTASATAAALLTVTSASSAPVSAMRCSSAARKRGPRRPASRSNSSSE